MCTSETGAQIVACGHEASVKSVSAQRTNSKVFASGSRDGNVFIWCIVHTLCCVRAGNLIRSHRDVRRLSHVPGSHLHPVAKLSSVHGAGQRSTRSRRSLPSPASQCVSAVQFVADDNILCTAGASDGTIKLFDLRKFATEHCVATYSMNAVRPLCDSRPCNALICCRIRVYPASLSTSSRAGPGCWSVTPAAC